MQQRRERVEKWRAQQNKNLENNQTNSNDEQPEEGKKTWTLEDENDDDEEGEGEQPMDLENDDDDESKPPPPARVVETEDDALKAIEKQKETKPKGLYIICFENYYL